MFVFEMVQIHCIKGIPRLIQYANIHKDFPIHLFFYQKYKKVFAI